MNTIPRILQFDFDKKTYIMGVLNVTPDSFSDGGQFFDTGKAVEHAFTLKEDGADILDIGGESTRPGSDPVPFEEELRRVIPVIEAVANKIDIPLSIDTCKAAVAERALDAGALIINDVSGLRFDPEMKRVAAQHGAQVILMHMKGTPKSMQKNPVYDALIPEIMDYLRISIREALDAGIPEEHIIIDPGIGFGKTIEHNLEIIRNLAQFKLLNKPVAIGVSRKAFIGKILGDAPVTDRIEGTAAAVAASVLNGADIVRVHDVKEMAKVVRVADAIKRGRVNKTGL